MGRTALITMCCAVTALAVASAPAVAAPAPGTARVSVPVCHSDVAPLDRRITWVGDMTSLRQGNRMEMRFQVFMRTPADPVWRLVQAPDLGIWNRAKPGTSQYTFRQKAVNLTAPATYKARLTYRWTGPGKQKTATMRTSKVCEQRDPRPNLRVVRIDASPAAAGMASYVVVVRNVGVTAVGKPNGFGVQLSVDGVAQGTRDVQGLRPGERVQVNISAARCKPGGTFRATVDPDARVDQSDRADDVLELPCPATLN